MKHPLCLVCLVALVLACTNGYGKSQDQKYASSGLTVGGSDEDPVYRFEDDDAAMNTAIATAKSTVDQFISQLRKPPKPGLYFSVKKPFPTSHETEEHIWLSKVTFDGSSFHGVVDNEPVDVPGLRIGDRVKVSREELSDWMIVDATGRLTGGYTIRAIRDRLTGDDRADFDEETGLIFD